MAERESLAQLKKAYDESPFFHHIGFEFVELEKGHVKLKLDIRESLMNTIDMLHGGVYATMIDNIIGITARSITQQPLVTVQLNIHFMEAMKQGTVFAVANMNRIGKSLVTGQGEILDEDGRVLAMGSGTFKRIG